MRLFLCLSLLAMSCGQPNAKSSTRSFKEFEGVITYKIYYVNKPDSAGKADTMRVIYSKGNMVREYNPTAKNQLKKEIFFASNNAYYSIITGIDSAYSFDLKDAKLKLIHSDYNATPVNILGRPCERLKFDEVFMGKAKFYVSNIFLYNKDILRVDKKYFSNWHFGNFDKYISEAGCLYLRFESDIQLYSQDELARSIYEAVDIKEQPVDPKVFLIDTSRVKRMKF